MADAIPPMIIDIQLQTSQLKAQINNLQSQMKGLDSTVKNSAKGFDGAGVSLKRLATAAVGLVAGNQLVNWFMSTAKAADSFNAQFEGVNQVFGKGAKQVQEYAKNAAELSGVSATAALNAAKNFGVYGKAAGLAGQANADFSTTLVKTAGDLGSFYDLPTETALNAIASGLRGETEPLRQFGILLDDASLRTQALSMKLIANTKEALTPQQKVLAANALILKQVGSATNDFTNYQGTFGNALKTVQAKLEDLKTQIGQGLIPALENALPKIKAFIDQVGPKLVTAIKSIPWDKLITGLTDSFQWFMDNAQMIKNWVFAIGGTYAAIKTYVTVIKAAKEAQILFNLALNTNPIMLAVTAVGLLVLGIMELQRALEGIGEKDLANKSRNAANAAGQKAYDAYLRTAKREQTNTGPGSILPSEIVAANKARQDAYDKSMKKVVTIKDNLNASVRNVGTGTGTPDLGDGGGGGGGGSKAADKLAKARAAADKKFVTALRATQKAISDANDDYNKAVQAANDKYGALIKQYADEMTGIVQTSMNRLRDAFRNAVQVNVGDIFKGLVEAGKATTDDLLGALKARLTSAKALADNAAALAGAGFSQVFIEQVVAQGPDLGNQLAETLKNATPESQKELQDLFQQTQNLSNSGMDKLAIDLYNKAGLATDELKSLYDAANANMLKAQEDLAAALLLAANALNESMTKIQTDFEAILEAMSAAAIKHAKTIADTMAKINAGKTTAVKAGATSSSVPYANQIATPFSASQADWNKISVTNNIETNASPSLIADTTVAAIKYGIPLSKLTA